MFHFLGNPIMSHLVAAGVGALGAWMGTHWTAIRLAETNAKKDVAVAITDAKNDLADAKKVV